MQRLRMLLLLILAVLFTSCGANPSANPNFLQSTAPSASLIEMGVHPNSHTFGITIYNYKPTDRIIVYTSLIRLNDNKLQETKTNYQQILSPGEEHFDVTVNLDSGDDRLISCTITAVVYRGDKLIDKVTDTLLFNYPNE